MLERIRDYRSRHLASGLGFAINVLHDLGKIIYPK